MTYSDKMNKLTDIPVNTLNKIWDITLLYISNELHQQKNAPVKKVIIPPLGVIEVTEGESELSCQFTPSNSLLKAIELSNNEVDALELLLNKELVVKLEKICSHVI